MENIGKPVLFEQRFEDKFINVVCSKCGAQLPSVDYQLAVVNDPSFLGEIYVAPVPHNPKLSWPPVSKGNDNGPCRCDNGCGNIYCSRVCRERAVRDGHNLLCVGPVNEDHPLYKFRLLTMQAPEEIQMEMCLAAQMFAYSVAREERERNGSEMMGAPSSEPPLLPTFSAVRDASPWWDISKIIQSIEDSDEIADDTEDYVDMCRDMLLEAYELLAQAIVGLSNTLGKERDSVEYFGKLLTFLSQHSFRFGGGDTNNSNAPATTSVLAEYCRHQFPSIMGTDRQHGVQISELLLNAARTLHGGADDEIEDDVSEHTEESNTSPSDGEIREEATPSLNQILVDPAKYFPGVNGIAWYVENIDMRSVKHSCLPNSEVVFTAGETTSLGMTLKWRLKHSNPCDASGTTLSFIPRNLPFETRTYYLAELGILDCKCPLCTYEGKKGEAESTHMLKIGTMKDLAVLAQEDGRHADAISIFREILTMIPNDAECLYGLSRVLSWDDKWNDGHEFLMNALKLAPGDKTISGKCGEALSYYPYNGTAHGVEKSGGMPPLDSMFDTVVEGNVFISKENRPLIPPDLCALIIETVETSMKGRWATSRHYAVPTTDVPVRDVAPILPLFNSLLQTFLFPALAHLFHAPPETLRIVDAFIVKYNASKQRALPVHCDQSQFSFTVALNDRREYEGGGLYLAQSQTVHNVDSGGVVCFTGSTEHGGFPLFKGVRYIIAVFAYSTDANKSV